jgi:hypothetical protein
MSSFSTRTAAMACAVMLAANTQAQQLQRIISEGDTLVGGAVIRLPSWI